MLTEGQLKAGIALAYSCGGLSPAIRVHSTRPGFFGVYVEEDHYLSFYAINMGYGTNSPPVMLLASQNRGTLQERLIDVQEVVAIMLGLAAIVVPNFFGNSASAAVRQLEREYGRLLSDHGYFRQSNGDLVKTIQNRTPALVKPAA